MALTKFKLDTKASRSKLPARSGLAPYFERIGAGCYLGFRPSVHRDGSGAWVAIGDGSGSWVARYRDDDGKQITKKLESTDSYDEAVVAARRVCKLAARGVTVSNEITVEEACRRYVKAFELEGNADAAADAEGRFNRLVYSEPDKNKIAELADDHPKRWFGRMKLHKLKREHVRDWFGFISRKPDSTPADKWDEVATKVSANRNFDALRSALNMALGDRLVDDGHAWDIKKHSDVKRSRGNVYLTKRQRKRLIADYGMCPETQKFTIFLALTGMRPGAAAKLRAKDWEPELGVLTISSDKANSGRKIMVSSKVASILTGFVAKLKPDDLVFGITTQFVENGTKVTRRAMWNRYLWKDRIRAAANRAMQEALKLAEQHRANGDIESAKIAEADAAAYEGAVLYSLRHSAITDLVLGGMDLLSVATLTGTSVEMIERYYGHLSDKARTALDALGF